MSKVSNMSIAEIINQVDIVFDVNNINKFCFDQDARNRIYELVAAGKDLYEVILDNEEYIDKEKLLLVSWLCNKEDIAITEEKLSDTFITPLNKARLEQEIRNLRNNQLKIKKLSRDMDSYLVAVHTKEDIVTDITIKSSREEIQGYDFLDREKLNRRIFNYVDENLRAQPNELGMKYALQTVEYEDLFKVLPFEIAKAVEYKIKINTSYLGKKYIDTLEEKQREGQLDEREINTLNDEYQLDVFLPEFRTTVEQVLKYIDLNKLLLIEIYRLEEKLNEEGIKLSNKQLIAAKEVASTILEIIDKKIILEENGIIYTCEDAQKFLDRINVDNNLYVTKKEEITLKNKLLHGLDIADIEGDTLEKICILKYTSDELETIMAISKSNFAFGMTMQDLSEEEIIQKAHQYQDKWSDELTKHFFFEGKLSNSSILGLHYDGIISAEFIKEFSEDNDISSEINLEKIQTLNLQIKKQKEHNEEDVKKLDSMINLYKLIDFDNKEEKEKGKIYTQIIEITEDDEDILLYYKKGLLTLEIVAEWSGETAIEKLYDESKITFEDIEGLYKSGKISINLLKSKFETEGLDYSSLLSYIDLGYVSEEKVIELYMTGKIFDYDFEDMFVKGIIPIPKYLEATSRRTKEELEKNAKIKFKPTLVNIPDKKIRLETIDDGTYPGPSITRGNKKTLIDPNIRYEFLKLLGAKEAEAMIEDENNAFYNYEFFVIPDPNGELQANSVVIAERFFKDRETQDEFSTDNATYFFQYKDLMVNSNLNKKEMTQDRDNIVFTANHRAGSWAVSVLYRIAQTLAGDNLKNYKKGDERAGKVLDELHKIYTSEEIGRILELTRQIDDTGEYIYEEVNSSYSKKKTEELDENEER